MLLTWVLNIKCPAKKDVDVVSIVSFLHSENQGYNHDWDYICILVFLSILNMIILVPVYCEGP